MSGHGCTVDSSLPETFLHERILFSNPQSDLMEYNQPQAPVRDSLIDFYKDEVAHCSGFVWKTPDVQPKKKSSSLKSAISTGGGGEKKIVRFADVLGLDLTDVHTFLDEIPKIPKSAFKDLKNVDVAPASSPKPEKTLVSLFPQPASQNQFTEKLAYNKVCLENAFITNTISLNVRGTIRVVNVHFEKKVTVRYSTDKWKTFVDTISQYLEGSSDGFSDRFSFTLPASDMSVGQRMEFAIKYNVLDTEYWDNNSGINYVFQCMPDSPPKLTSSHIPSTTALENWGFFY
ncbi:glycogen-binding subunit 76A [Cimex lectularius]|uniref:CBM21 domain-containing protein n=1 Tax=Cimex lectularius TaxID=79782 RepID=A0A8I6REQ4_CIMLE|nr:glycogen-binding subunit 76A [Cimex lectularius]